MSNKGVDEFFRSSTKSVHAMKEYAQQSRSKSRALESNPKASRQAPPGVILQQYHGSIQQNGLKNDNQSIHNKFNTVQRESTDKERFLQRKVRTASAIIQKKQKRAHFSLQGKKLSFCYKENPSNRCVIQGVFNAVFGAGNGVILTPADGQKLGEVVNILNAMPDTANTNLGIMITVDGLTNSNPASTILVGQVINISIRHWVVRKNSAAFIAGMIAHECGAHTLADSEMTPANQVMENNLNPLNRTVNAGGHPYTIHPAANRPGAQQDHINSAKVDNNIALWSPRAKAYLHTLVRIGNGIVVPAPIGGGIVPLTPLQRTKLNELLQTYLFDIARIIVEDDQAGLGIILHTSRLSDVMNWLYSLIAPPAPAALPIPTQPTNDWIRQLNFHSRGWSLFSMLASRFGSFLSAWVTTKIRGHL